RRPFPPTWASRRSSPNITAPAIASTAGKAAARLASFLASGGWPLFARSPSAAPTRGGAMKGRPRKSRRSNAPAALPGGSFAGPSNIGTHSHSHIAVLPEVGVNFGYMITENVTLTAGYTFLYLSHVVRPAEQIDRVVNFQTNDRPSALLRETDFWAQGVSF